MPSISNDVAVAFCGLAGALSRRGDGWKALFVMLRSRDPQPT